MVQTDLRVVVESRSCLGFESSPSGCTQFFLVLPDEH